MCPGERLELDLWASGCEQRINFSGAFFFESTSVKAAIHISVCEPSCVSMPVWQVCLAKITVWCGYESLWKWLHVYVWVAAASFSLTAEKKTEEHYSYHHATGNTPGLGASRVRLKGGAQVKQIWGAHCGMSEILMQHPRPSVWAVKTPSPHLQSPPVSLCSLSCRNTHFDLSLFPTATSPSLSCEWNLLGHASLLPDANLTTTCI